jgi:predicted nucleic acid-binding protein
LTCEAILTELGQKLCLKRGLSARKAAEVVNEIRAFSKAISIPGTLKIVTADPTDDPVVECAVVGQAAFIVSGDKHLLGLRRYEDIQIDSAAEFLGLLKV